MFAPLSCQNTSKPHCRLMFLPGVLPNTASDPQHVLLTYNVSGLRIVFFPGGQCVAHRMNERSGAAASSQGCLDHLAF